VIRSGQIIGRRLDDEPKTCANTSMSSRESIRSAARAARPQMFIAAVFAAIREAASGGTGMGKASRVDVATKAGDLPKAISLCRRNHAVPFRLTSLPIMAQ
jgi:hypothetical protein